MANLSTYLDNVQRPNYWSAAHYPIEFSAQPQTRTNVLIQNNSGYAQITFSSAFNLFLGIGQFIYISDGAYKGFHTIRTINSSFQVVTNTTYTVNDNTAHDVRYCPTLQFDLYKGYKSAEEYPTELPLEQIATFTVEINTKTLTYTWNVSGYLKSIFTIVPPLEGIDFNLFNRYRLYLYGEELEFYQVANASLPQDDYWTTYANTNAPLSSGSPIIFICGKTIISKLQNNVIVNTVVENAIELPEFNNTFNTQFKITP